MDQRLSHAHHAHPAAMSPRFRTSLFVAGLILLNVISQGAPGELKWSFTTAGPVRSSPVIGANGLVYFGSLDGNVYALEASGGVERWRYKQEQEIHSSPTIASNGAVIIGS